MNKKITKKAVLATTSTMVLFGLAGCSAKIDNPDGYNYNTYTTVSPSNWNELTYQDNNDTQIMNYLGSDLFEFDYKFDENGEIIDDAYSVKYSAATALKDVSAIYAEKWGLKNNDGTTQDQRAYEITLRDDLEWSDGTPIDAYDFVYSMQEQLNPDFMHYRADSYYYGTSALVGAENYAKQGKKYYSLISNLAETDLVSSGNGFTYNDEVVFISLESKITLLGNSTLKSVVNEELTEEQITSLYTPLANAADSNGYVALTADTKSKLSSIFSILNAIEVEAEEVINAEDTNEDEPEMKYTATYLNVLSRQTVFADDVNYDDTVGLFATSDYKLVIIFANQLDLLNDDESLSYKAAYNLANLPLVKEDLYKTTLKEPTTGSSLWTTDYNSSVKTTACWGPYNLTSFQTSKEFVLEKNDNWFGFDLEANKDLYQTQKIVTKVVQDWNTAWLMFQNGEVESIGIDVSISGQYKSSERAYFTPSSFIQSIQLQSNQDALQSYSDTTSGMDTMILTIPEFREALSLSINRADYTNKNTTSSQAGYGLFNSMHYNDVANAGVYRDTDEAKIALCNSYGIDTTNLTSEELTEAVDNITGYDVTKAKELFEKAYQDALANTSLKATDNIPLRIVTSGISESTTRQKEYLQAAWDTATEGTSLEGKIKVSELDKASMWADEFRGGAGEITLGGWSGAAWDPGYFLLAYLSPAYMYSTGWDTSSHMMEFTFQGQTHNMSVLEWYNCLNGHKDSAFNWNAANLTEEERVPLIARLEQEVLMQRYTVPLLNSFSATLMSYKVDYITYEYNTFMGYGGLKYMTYNFTNGEWAKVAKNADYTS